MPAETATIRVTRSTRDLLRRNARRRGVSVARLVADMAREDERAAIWQSERDAVARDASNEAVVAEQQEWEATLTDGID